MPICVKIVDLFDVLSWKCNFYGIFFLNEQEHQWLQNGERESVNIAEWVTNIVTSEM